LEVKLNILQHRANFALGKLASARTPLEKSNARAEAFAIKADLEKFLNDENALKAFKAAKPKSSFGVYGDGTGRVIFMVPSGNRTQTAAVELPDGTRIVPVQNQIPVPDNMVAAMTNRGWVRANSVITDLSGALGMGNPVRPNNT
jgi:hypothetical protein